MSELIFKKKTKMQEGHFIFFDVVTSDGTRVDPDESNTIALHIGVSFSVRLRDMPPGCNGGLAYFTYNGSMFHPHEYAMVREGRILVFAKAVINTPEAEAYLHEYTMYVQGTPPPQADKKDPVYDDAIDFFLQEDLGDDARPFRTHPLKEEVPLVLKSGTNFRLDARALVNGSEAYVSRFEYNNQQRSMGECTVADGERQLIVYGYRRLSKVCGDVLTSVRTFTIFGQPKALPLPVEESAEDMEEGLVNVIFRAVDSSDALLDTFPVDLATGCVEIPENTRFTVCVNEPGYAVSSFIYHGKTYKANSSLIATVPELSDTVRQTPIAVRVWCASGWSVVNKHFIIRPVKKNVTEEKMADTKEGSSSSYNLFVETCDDDPVCYPVGDDGRVEVPAGTRFRFVATSKHEGRKADVHCFTYQEDETSSRLFCTKAPVTRFVQVSSVTVVETRLSDKEVAAHRTVDVTIIPIFNDRSGWAAPVADVKAASSLGKDVEYDGLILAGPGKKDDKSAASGALVKEKDALEQLIFCSPCGEEFVYDSDTRTVVIPPGYVFQVKTACSGHKINWCTYRGERALRPNDKAFVSMAMPAVLKIHITTGPMTSYTVEVQVIPCVTKADYDGIILTTTEPAKKTHTVPVCADAEGTYGKRFITPWNDKERACEECFLTRVVDPRGWKATTGSGACNYTPMRVWLERADGDDMPFAENEKGEYLVPYGTRVVAKTDRGEVHWIFASGCSRRSDKPFEFLPSADASEYWDVDVGVRADPAEHNLTNFRFRIIPEEDPEELEKAKVKYDLERNIRETDETLIRERKALDRTLNRIQTAQDKLTELKVEQAKLESK